MRAEYVRGDDGAVSLRYRVAEGMEVDRALIAAASYIPAAVLLPGSVLRFRDGGVALAYGLAGETLSQRLCRAFDANQVRTLLIGLSVLMESIAAGGLSLANVRFALDEVVVGPEGVCRFVLLPVSGMESEARAVRAFLSTLGARLVPADSGAEAVIASYRALLQGGERFEPVGFSRRLRAAVSRAQPGVGADAGLSVPAMPDPMRFYLTRPSTGERIEISGGRFVVGRSKSSSFQIKNATTVSRSHAVFSAGTSACTVEDGDSRNGTFVNGEQLQPGVSYRLADGDVIRMSDEDFVFEARAA